MVGGQQRARPLEVASASNEFKKRYKRKSPKQQAAVEEAIKQVELDANHPSLGIEPIDGRAGHWSIRGSLSVRLSFVFVEDDTIQLRMNCTHDQVYRRR